MGYVEWQLTTEPINGGWPYCHGPNANYNEWDFATGTPGEWFDCEAGAKNNSTWNTGLDVVPPATAPQVYYGDRPGDQPELLDPLVELGGGGQAPMGGPIFRSADYPDAPGKFPAYWDGKPFMAEFSQDYVVAFTLDELSSAGEVTAVEDFLPNAHLETVNQPIWDNVMDMEFGPDGSMYVLEYGTASSARTRTPGCTASPTGRRTRRRARRSPPPRVGQRRAARGDVRRLGDHGRGDPERGPDLRLGLRRRRRVRRAGRDGDAHVHRARAVRGAAARHRPGGQLRPRDPAGHRRQHRPGDHAEPARRGRLRLGRRRPVHRLGAGRRGRRRAGVHQHPVHVRPRPQRARPPR